MYGYYYIYFYYRIFFYGIYIKHGGYDEKNEMYMRESEERLKDPTYVQKLIYYGYDVPEKYR